MQTLVGQHEEKVHPSHPNGWPRDVCRFENLLPTIGNMVQGNWGSFRAGAWPKKVRFCLSGACAQPGKACLMSGTIMLVSVCPCCSVSVHDETQLAHFHHFGSPILSSLPNILILGPSWAWCTIWKDKFLSLWTMRSTCAPLPSRCMIPKDKILSFWNACPSWRCLQFGRMSQKDKILSF